MKKNLLIVMAVMVIFAMLMVSCTRTGTAGMEGIVTNDTIGLAEYQAWKAKTALAGLYTANQPAPKQHSVTQAGNSQPAIPVAQNDAEPVKKKGWSKAAKGAVIGAGSGAAIGAVINKKNRAIGAVIGGIIGGGGGYALGRTMDKKDGRY
jgi:YMGG-like Gly-zipper